MAVGSWRAASQAQPASALPWVFAWIRQAAGLAKQPLLVLSSQPLLGRVEFQPSCISTAFATACATAFSTAFAIWQVLAPPL